MAARSIAAACFLGMLVGVAGVFAAGASPLPAAGALYAATVAWGVGEMAHLRERVLYRPQRPPPPHSALLWWGVRLVVVVLVSTLPAALMLGGLAAR